MTASLFLCCFRSQIITPFVLHQMKCVCINIIFEMKPYADLREIFYDVSISSLQTNPHGRFILGSSNVKSVLRPLRIKLEELIYYYQDMIPSPIGTDSGVWGADGEREAGDGGKD
ncbi:hypothetical protein MRB53_028297 [Persea americana]|uniref:Uncharacterized protein n=1 Tax=Persea americana TaxID=3435 RepID=A0ACC2KFS8_PERAE|nr:hypothetical protein MRB53_028297 [Persea americana]